MEKDRKFWCLAGVRPPNTKIFDLSLANCVSPILLFIVVLSLSGITAIPLIWETTLLNRLATSEWLRMSSLFPQLVTWISRVNPGLVETYRQYPFLAYGTDWLAFGHSVITIAFLGALMDPVKNLWVIEFGMIACLLVIPWALIFGTLRSIPFFWRLIDCSFGVAGSYLFGSVGL